MFGISIRSALTQKVPKRRSAGGARMHFLQRAL